MGFKTAYGRVRRSQLASGSFKKRFRKSKIRKGKRTRTFKSRPTAYGYIRGKNLPF